MSDDVSGSFPRPLSSRESALLNHMLSLDLPGIEALRAQAASASVVGACGCGCPTIDLEVQVGPLRSYPFTNGYMREPDETDGSGNIPERVEPDSTNGWGIILFVRDGRLSCLELYSFDDVPPSLFPDPAFVRVEPYRSPAR